MKTIVISLALVVLCAGLAAAAATNLNMDTPYGGGSFSHGGTDAKNITNKGKVENSQIINQDKGAQNVNTIDISGGGTIENVSNTGEIKNSVIVNKGKGPQQVNTIKIQ